MKMNRTKKMLSSLFLAACLIAGLAPSTALATETGSGQPALTVNQSKVAFAGHEWWVIGNETSGVYPQPGHITLLAANADFGAGPFRSALNYEADGYAEYASAWYINNPEGMDAWKTPNEYAGSTLQQKMESIANGFSPKEQSVISARNLANGATEDNDWSNVKTDFVDGIAGPGIANQKVWALSDEELVALNDAEVRKYDQWWSLRSPSIQGGGMSRTVHRDGSFREENSGIPDNDARPALSLNLSSVFFASAADASGKSAAVAEGGLVDISSPDGTVKLTMKDAGQKLTVNATAAQSTQTGEALSFSYFGATAGDKQYVSCVLTDASGAAKYYGKLADCSSASGGDLSVPLAGVADGTYTLQIFSEQANGDLHTDFCSEPVTMKVAVAGGNGTVSEFGGTIHEHSWSDAWTSDNTHHWHECAVSGCPVTDNSRKDGYAEHIYDQMVEDDLYLKSAADCDSPSVYYKSCVCGAFSETADTFTKGAATGHSWGEPEWIWSDDGKTAAVTFVCNNDSTHTQSPAVTIASAVKSSATCTEKGTTTYTAKAIFDGREHTSTKDVADIEELGHILKKTDKVDATCTTDGKEAYYTCEVCRKHFSDAEGNDEITELEEYGIIPATGTTEPTEPSKPTGPDKGNPDKGNPDTGNPDKGTVTAQTGDNSNSALWIALLLASGSTLAATALYDRKRRKTER